MRHWNVKQIVIYLILLAALALVTVFNSGILAYANINQILQGISFSVPVFFLVSVFLAFKINEARIVTISFVLLAMSLSDHAYSYAPWIATLSESVSLRLLIPLALSLVFIIPDKIMKRPSSLLRIAIAVLPFLLVSIPSINQRFLNGVLFDEESILSWVWIVPVALPVLGAYIYRDRKTQTLASAVSVTGIAVSLPAHVGIDKTLDLLSLFVCGLILLHALYRLYWESAYIDELTGLYNRRALDEKMKTLHKNYCLSMVDIDHFKNFNDTYGHDSGDHVLRLVATILYNNFHRDAYRYGGEEFCVIFKNKDIASSAASMDKARSDIEEHKFAIRNKSAKRAKSGRKTGSGAIKRVKLTISAGVAACTKTTTDASLLLKSADKALYAAKNNGRNRVEVKG